MNNSKKITRLAEIICDKTNQYLTENDSFTKTGMVTHLKNVKTPYCSRIPSFFEKNGIIEIVTRRSSRNHGNIYKPAKRVLPAQMVVMIKECSEDYRRFNKNYTDEPVSEKNPIINENLASTDLCELLNQTGMKIRVQYVYSRRLSKVISKNGSFFSAMHRDIPLYSEHHLRSILPYFYEMHTSGGYYYLIDTRTDSHLFHTASMRKVDALARTLLCHIQFNNEFVAQINNYFIQVLDIEEIDGTIMVTISGVNKFSEPIIRGIIENGCSGIL